jgi:parvulin-like peptidyl-prolyl isomerase
MMRQLRQNTKIILWIVVVAFVTTIFAVWGMDLKTGSPSQDPSLLGKINGVPITRSIYRSAYEMLAENVRNNSPDGQVSYAQAEMIQEQAWENIVISMLTNQQIEKLGIKVTDEEIVNFLRNTPPPEIQRFFLDEEGNFNYQAYQQALNDPTADWTDLENFARERLPLIKLNQFLGAQVHVSDDEIRRAYQREHTRLLCQYVEFVYEDENVEDYVPSDDQINAYYNEHIEEYTDSEKASVEIVKIDIEPSDIDREDVYLSMGNIREQLVGGEDFATLAKTYSEAPTSENNGATGWIGPEQRPSQIIEALAAIEDGELSEPVEAEDGYYLLKRLGERSAGEDSVEYDAQEIFMRFIPRSATLDSLLVLANDLHERAQTVGLRGAAEEMKFEVLTPSPISQNFPVEGLGFLPGLGEFAFNNEPGALSRVMRDETRYYICQLLGKIPESPRPLADVSDNISRSMVYERSKQLARQKAETLYNDAKKMGFEAAAQSHQWEIVKSDTFKVNENLAGLGPNSRLARTALSLQEGIISSPIETRRSYFIAQLLYRTPIDEEDYQQNSPSLTGRLYQEKLQSFIAHWYAELKENSEIEDYRNNL